MAALYLKSITVEQLEALEEENLSGKRLVNLDLTGILLPHREIQETNFSRSSLRYAHLENAQGEKAIFISSNLYAANCLYGCFNGAIFRQAICNALNAKHLLGLQCNFNRIQGIVSNFSYAQLGQSSFFQANLKYANFQKAHLHGVNFKKATLVGANFSEADLRGADFSGANLKEAIFRGANLEGVCFEGVQGLE
jgi:hypothetical protein